MCVKHINTGGKIERTVNGTNPDDKDQAGKTVKRCENSMDITKSKAAYSRGGSPKTPLSC